jgi:putative intracellular protease/amidase
MSDINILLFDGFETLDAMGPAEVFGRLTNFYRISCRSLAGGKVTSAQNIVFATAPLAEADSDGILLIPGGRGTRSLVKDETAIGELKKICEMTRYVLTVCTGSALLARTKLLDGHRETTNKIAFDWASSQSERVKWQRRARWVVDGKYYTSSGISAGIDMSLGFICDMHGKKTATETARQIEYVWNDDMTDDPFAMDEC